MTRAGEQWLSTWLPIHLTTFISFFPYTLLQVFADPFPVDKRKSTGEDKRSIGKEVNRTRRQEEQKTSGRPDERRR